MNEESPAGSYNCDYRQILPVQWLNKDLFPWFRAQVILEGRSTGEVINGLIFEYWREAARTNSCLEVVSPFELYRDNQLSIRGIDRELWRWLRSPAVLFDESPGRILNELIASYRSDRTA